MCGIFISAEGTDGAGKSTQLEFIKKYLEERKKDAVFLREPGGNAISEKIRNVILDTENIAMTPQTEALLYAASRIQLVNEVIVPALEEGKIVVCDRYIDSSIAYQGYGRKLTAEKIEEINGFAISKCTTCMVVFSILFGFGSCFFWPPVQNVISALTDLIATSGNFGLFLYGFLERFLIPTGLHHLIYTPFQFSALGNSLTVGDATYTGSYIVMMMEYSMGLPFSDGIVWMYTGFTKTFGYFGIVAAFIFCARKENRKKTAAVLVPLAFTASLASITEPLDFMFCFSAPILWVAHACISGLFIVLLHIFHVTGFTTNLLGSVLMNLSAGADKTNYPTLYLLALCQIAVYFVVFTLLIKAFNIHTPGREEVSTETAGSAAPAKKASVKNAAEVQCVIDGLGGKENILSVDNCFTRLRVNIKDPAKLDEAAINRLPNSGIVKKGTDIQIVYGLQVADIKRAVETQLENQ